MKNAYLFVVHLLGIFVGPILLLLLNLIEYRIAVSFHFVSFAWINFLLLLLLTSLCCSVLLFSIYVCMWYNSKLMKLNARVQNYFHKSCSSENNFVYWSENCVLYWTISHKFFALIQFHRCVSSRIKYVCGCVHKGHKRKSLRWNTLK